MSIVDMARTTKKSEYLTSIHKNMDNDPLWEESDREKNTNSPLATKALTERVDNFHRLKDSSDFREYANKNLWKDRRTNGYPWRCDVFEFIADVYAPFLGHGLLQSDLGECDPALYAQMHKKLSEMTSAQRDAKLSALRLPKERSPEALEILFPDPEERAKQAIVREHEQARVARSRLQR